MNIARRLKCERYRRRLHRHYSELKYHLQSGKNLFRTGYALERDLYDIFARTDVSINKEARFVELCQLMGQVH